MKIANESDTVDTLDPVTQRSYMIAGIAVDHYQPAMPARGAPVVLVHGGNHASWMWGLTARFLAGRGYEVHALDWYSHGDSTGLPREVYLNRGIGAVASVELARVVDALGVDPVLVGHSMGGLAAAVYASRQHVAGLALLAPVPPAQAEPGPIPVEIDYTAPFEVPPFEVARALFFSTMPEAEARRWYGLLEPESPRAVFDAARGAVWLRALRVDAPALLVAAEKDALYSVAAQERFAALLRAEFVVAPGVGHSDLVLQSGVWVETARRLDAWLSAVVCG